MDRQVRLQAKEGDLCIPVFKCGLFYGDYFEADMKEEEALDRWCPFLQIANLNKVFSQEIQTCSGSQCMMWRWEKRDCFVNGVEKKDYPIDEGYCGLSGKP